MEGDTVYISYKSPREIALAMSIIETNNLYLGEEDGHFFNKRERYSGICNIIDAPEYYKVDVITLAKIGDTFVGCAMKVSNKIHGCNTCTYVKQNYRRRGIGSEMLKRTIDYSSINNYCHPEGFPKVY